MRDVICHEYFGVRMERVWKVVRKDLQALAIQMEEIRDEIR